MLKVEPRTFKPFHHILVPVLPGIEPRSALALANALGAQITMVGLVPVASEAPISVEAATARQLRSSMRKLGASISRLSPVQLCVTSQPVEELLKIVSQCDPDLLMLELPLHFDALGCQPVELLNRVQTNVALIRGPFPKARGRVLVPLRGGPYAELGLRLGITIPHTALDVVNLASSAHPDRVEESFRGLERILPRLSGVNYRRLVTDDFAQWILTEAQRADVLIMGASAQPQGGGLGRVIEQVISQVSGAVVVVKAEAPLPERWTGADGERAGKQAISILVDRWFAENTYHAKEFDDLKHLVALKERQQLRISAALPALNEEKTVGKVIQSLKTALMDKMPLLDEIVLIDSNSTDRTRQIASDLGVPVYIHQELLPMYGARTGKGEALWKSLLVTHGDILVWVDTDIVNFHPRFVYGVIGPLLMQPSLQFVKGFYRRPLRSGARLQAGGGGRVTELTARPLLNLFYPELSGVIQPLSGEYGGRRKALESLPFFSGYGVEIGLLIDIFERFGLQAIAQVDLLERIHHNQPLDALSKMSFTILQAVLRKLESRVGRPFLEDVNKTMKLVQYNRGNYFLDIEEVAEMERPAMIEIPEYGAAAG
ncbi:MAG: glucosyl-3-phosphoglycerate synthase [Anaerolineaceae bacterium]|nr:glucosyl-3-phosphoglycerate synthase [Anaerolineaceae bacterium]